VAKRQVIGKKGQGMSPAKEGDTLDRENYVPYYINMISNKLSRGSSRIYIRKFGIGVIEWRILGFLKREGTRTANDLCLTLAIDKSAASRAIHVMQVEGLIAVDPIDRRQRSLSLTKRGISLHDQILPIARERERILLSSLNDGERKELLRLLRKLREGIAAVNEYEP